MKMWDIRAEECVYELSTGNNAVTGLAWDGTRSALYVATECRYLNRMGLRTGYRRARIPKWARLDLAGADTGDDGEEDRDDEEYDSDDYDDDGENWPKNAYHSEDSFGYAFDAGEHTLREYSII